MNIASVVVFILVLLISMLCARKYNFIHGFITYFALGILLYAFCFFAQKALGACKFVLNVQEVIAVTEVFVVGALQYILETFKLSKFFSKEYIMIFIPLAIWIISWVLSIGLKKLRNRE